MREIKCSIVMGNSDAWLMTGVETDAHLISEERRKKLDIDRAWSLSKLDEEDRAFINAFQPTVTVDLGHGRNLLAFHGPPTSFDQFLLPSTTEGEFQEILKPYANNILTGGHMHLQYTRRLRDSQNFFFNPGSVGVAYNHEHRITGQEPANSALRKPRYSFRTLTSPRPPPISTCTSSGSATFGA